MRIQDASIAIATAHTGSREYRAEESLRVERWGAGGETRLETRRSVELREADIDTYLQLGPNRSPVLAALILPPAWQAPSRTTQPAPVATAGQPGLPEAADPAAEAQALAATDSELLLLKLVIEWLSGREIEVARIGIDTQATPGAGGAPVTPAAVAASGFSIDYRYTEHYEEQESTRFLAAGTVRTADGRQLAFALALDMQRHFESTTTVSVQAGTRKDPLVLNLGGAGPELGTTRVRFDLDGDGAEEEIAFATGASAFLALDRDGDGRITSGRELFGATSGDGFAELARYDRDGSGFIDEADPVYTQLLAFGQDAAGTERLASLATLGVGALWLGSAATPFELRTADNAPLGAVRRTGLYLREDGSAGTLQQLDLVV